MCEQTGVGGGDALGVYLRKSIKNEEPFTFIMRTEDVMKYMTEKCIHYALALFATRVVFFFSLSFFLSRAFFSLRGPTVGGGGGSRASERGSEREKEAGRKSLQQQLDSVQKRLGV